LDSTLTGEEEDDHEDEMAAAERIRAGMHPITLEAIMYLRYNSTWWDLAAVREVMEMDDEELRNEFEEDEYDEDDDNDDDDDDDE